MRPATPISDKFIMTYKAGEPKPGSQRPRPPHAPVETYEATEGDAK
jgi:sarcosine oxidase subunit delta